MTPARRDAVLAAALAALAIVAYSNALPGGLVYDDVTLVRENVVVREHALPRAFVSPYHQGPWMRVPSGLYRPLTIASLAANHAAHGEAPLGYHAVNVALHAAVTALVLLFGLAIGLPRAAAVAGAALFALHPVHVEAVAGIAGRADLLAALFFLLGLTIYARRRGAGGLAWAAALSLLAMLSKEIAVVFPAVALAQDLLVSRERDPSALGRRAAVLLAPLALYLALRGNALGGLLLAPGAVTPIENPVVGLAFGQRAATVLAVGARALGLLVFPWRLSPDYGFAETVAVTSALEGRFLAGAGCALALAAALALALRRSPRAAFLLIHGLLSWLVVSNAVITIGTILGERLLYLPSASFCLLAGMGFERLRAAAGRGRAVAVAAVVLVAAAGRTWTGCAAWRDDLSLFSAAMRSAPLSVRVLGGLGAEWALRGRFSEARELLERAVALAPGFAPNRITLAGVLLEQGEIEAAEREARAAVVADPGNPIPHVQLGKILLRDGREEEARAAFEEAVEVDPGFVDARLHLAEIHLRRGELDAAERHIEAALRADPRSEGARRGIEILRSLREGKP